MERYFGTYQTFRTVSKKDAAVLMGSNTLVGDRYRINLTMDEGVHRAWLINKFNETIGYFDDSFSRELSLFAAEGLELVGILSLSPSRKHLSQVNIGDRPQLSGTAPITQKNSTSSSMASAGLSARAFARSWR